MPVEGSYREYAYEVGDKIPTTAEVFRQGTPHKSLAGRRGTPPPSQRHRPSHCGARRGMGISSVSFRPSGCLETCCAGGNKYCLQRQRDIRSSSGDACSCQNSIDVICMHPLEWGGLSHRRTDTVCDPYQWGLQSVAPC